MAAIPTQTITDLGTTPTYQAASASDTLEYGNGTDWFAVYKNASGAAVTVTITPTGQTVYGRNLPAATYTVPAGGETWIPLRSAFDNGGTGAATGRATATLSATASVTVGVFKHA